MQGESRPRGTNPEHQQQSRTKQPRENNSRQKTHSQKKPATTLTKTKQKEKDLTTQATKGQPEQAEASKPYIAGPNTPPRENNRQGAPKKARGQKVDRQTGDQTKREKRKRIKYECTCPVCGQTHKYTSGQDQNMGREDRNESRNGPVPFAGMQVGICAVQRGSRP